MFTLKVLGDPVLMGPDGPVTGRATYKRRMALLAVLAAARGRPVSRDRIIALLWPEHASDSARHNLSESLYVLRRELGDAVFVSVGDEVALGPEVVGSDVAAFEAALEAGRLEDAVAEYGGPLLNGFHVSDAPDFERWVDGERERLARGYAQALEALAERAGEAGRALPAVEWWRRLAAHDPWSSRVALRLTGALEAAGERAAALRAAEAHVARMREELELAADPAVHAAIRRMRTEGAWEEPQTAAAAAPALTAAIADGARAGDDGLDGVRLVDDDAEAAGAVDAPVSDIPSEPPPAEPLPPVAEGVSATVPEDAPAGSAHAPPAAARTPRARWGLAAAAVLAVAVLVLAAAFMEPLRPPAPPPRDPRHDPRRIAVLYFDDDSPDRALGYLADGLTGALIDELSRVPALDVVSRNGVKAYRDGEVGYDSLLTSLRVGSVVEGTVQRSGDSIRVTVQLVDANRRAHLESRTLIRPMGELFALERAVGEEVSGFLRRRLGEEVRLLQTAAETRNSAALDLLMKGEEAREQAARLARSVHPLDAGSASGRLARADSFYAAAQAADPGWARPRVLRGFVALSRATLSPDSARPPLHAAAERYAGGVLSAEPRNALALELRGRARWERAIPDTAHQAPLMGAAERDLRAAVEADSTLAPAWLALSLLLRFRGRFADSDLAARRALAQDAWLEDADDILQRLYFGALAQAEYGPAADACDRGRQQFPGDWRFVECRLTLLREDPSRRPDPALAWNLAGTLEAMDPAARARAEGRAYSPVFRLALVAGVLARAGLGDSARAVIGRARSRAGADSEAHVSLLFDEARVMILLGDRSRATQALKTFVARRPALRPYLARDPLFHDLLAPPRPARPAGP